MKSRNALLSSKAFQITFSLIPQDMNLEEKDIPSNKNIEKLSFN